eukprot:jgi/Hompol1/99/HPOL_004065-RA
MAEIVAGAISMGLGGYLAGLSEIEHYRAERIREEREVDTVPHIERREIAEIFEPYGVPPEACEPFLDIICKDKKTWVDFMMKFELNLEEPDFSRTWISALTIGTSYFLGGLVPLVPYMAIQEATKAFYVSITATIVALFVFGYFKARVLGSRFPWLSAVQMALVASALVDDSDEDDGQTSSIDIIKDVIIGLSDGLTVPFALAAGLASLSNSKLVVLAGLAEIAAGSISMGLGGYLAGLSEEEHYYNQLRQQNRQAVQDPVVHRQSTIRLLMPYGISHATVNTLVDELMNNPRQLLDFIMRFDLGLEKPSKWRALTSAFTIGSSYFCGGLVPLFPYMFISNAQDALRISTLVTLAALFIFGFCKAKAIASTAPLYGALQMMIIGGLAALVAYTVAKAVPGIEDVAIETVRVDDADVGIAMAHRRR